MVGLLTNRLTLRVYDWISAGGYQAEGPPREVWHTGPTDGVPDMEVCWLLAEPS
jgi:hypothetical protein